jgi:large subunit ribosomal protein L10
MRPEKESIIKEITEAVSGSAYLLLTDFSGMKVSGLTALRQKLGETGSRVMVVKNSYLGVVLGEERRRKLGNILTGKTAMITGRGDVTVVAKTLTTFVKENKMPILKGGCLNTQLLTAGDIDAMAAMPPREVLLAQLVGTVQAPMTQLVGVMNAKVSSLLYVLTAIEEKKKSAA